MSEHREQIAAAIIAGGASSRFGGAPKGLEKVAGQRIVDRVIRAARTIASNVILVSNSDDANEWLKDVEVVRDVRPERGSIVGIHTALTVTGARTLVLAWDMPFITPELLELIVNRSEGEQFAAIPESVSGLEPFCALYTPSCLPLVDRAIDDGNLRATSLPLGFPSFTRITRSDVGAIGDPARLFFNVNSAADLTMAEELEREQRSRQR